MLKQLKKEGKRPVDVDHIQKHIIELSRIGVSYSRGELNIKEIRRQLLQGGFYYIATEIPLDNLFIKKETEDAIRKDELQNPSETNNKAPIVVGVVDGIEFFVIDGRHRVINARRHNEQKINAYIPLSMYAKYFSQKS